MKRKSLLVLLASVSVGSMVFGATAQKISAELKQQKIVCNGSEQIKQVVSYNGTTYVPLRQFGEMTGTAINYSNGIIYVGENNTITAPTKADKKEISFSINSVTKETDYEGHSVALVSVDMTNNSGTTKCIQDTDYYISAYQNGIELEKTFDVELAPKDEFTSILSGYTGTFNSLFILENDSPVVVEICTYSNTDKTSKTFNLN